MRRKLDWPNTIHLSFKNDSEDVREGETASTNDGAVRFKGGQRNLVTRLQGVATGAEWVDPVGATNGRLL